MVAPKNRKKFLPWVEGLEFLLLPETEWPSLPIAGDQVKSTLSSFISVDDIKLEKNLEITEFRVPICVFCYEGRTFRGLLQFHLRYVLRGLFSVFNSCGHSTRFIWCDNGTNLKAGSKALFSSFDIIK